MSRRNQREDRDWRAQQRNRQGQNPPYSDYREGDYGWGGQPGEDQDWNNENTNPRSGREMGGNWSRGQGQGQGMRGPSGRRNNPERGNEMPNRNREQNYGLQDPRNEWPGRERGWDWDNQTSPPQGSQSGRHWQEWNEPYEGVGGRGWYEGWRDAMSGQEGQHAGRGPRSYKRSDSRIEEDINDRLTQHGLIDATDIEVSVQNGEVTLRGHVENRQAKRLAEDIAESVFGIKDVNNQIKVRQKEWDENKQENETPGKQRKAS